MRCPSCKFEIGDDWRCECGYERSLRDQKRNNRDCEKTLVDRIAYKTAKKLKEAYEMGFGTGHLSDED
jgi:hypothetical protein